MTFVEVYETVYPKAEDTLKAKLLSVDSMSLNNSVPITMETKEKCEHQRSAILLEMNSRVTDPKLTF